MNRPLTYLAVPYSHPDPAVRLRRFEAANRAAGTLMREGVHVFSPISQTHPIAVQCGLPLDFDHWQAYNRAVLSCCNKLIVLQIDGWLDSVGVRAEIRMAREMGIEIRFMALLEMPDDQAGLITFKMDDGKLIEALETADEYDEIREWLAGREH